MQCRNLLPALGLLVSYAGPLSALEDDRKQPIHIKADHVEIDKRNGYSVYSGGVDINQGSLRIQGDSVTLYYEKGQLDKAVINGTPARFQQQRDKDGQQVVSQANTMEYHARRARLFLLDEARVTQGANSFAGARIEYDIQKSTVIANNSDSSSGRINAILAPANGSGQ
ncbi:MAG: lipopolysaccharide transport periplasmic protein LptA [Gammaproteobacteria bacterium]|nr:lipopolysaccharide transport periplasmic protein LptA [Gammaproteobacteria bacterium]MDH5653645.1 lipopolysaccharide transport periplasmic protein LptA [Gammaproteobacteria bacterium]